MVQTKQQVKGRYLALSRRERQVMDVLYREGRATAARVRELMSDAPSYSAVRALLRVLEEKDCIRHETEQMHYVYHAIIPRDEVQESALDHLVRTFFGGSVEAAVASLVSSADVSRAELDRLARMIEDRRKEAAR